MAATNSVSPSSPPESLSVVCENFQTQSSTCPSEQLIQRTVSSGNMSCATSDDSCAINELLEGRMDLAVILPAAVTESKKQEKVVINVERRQPMMDLLVNVSTQFKFNAANYKIHVDGHEFKANTPIGSLDVNEITIVAKSNKHLNKPTANGLSTASSNSIQLSRSPSSASVPFKTTFRLQVNLPRNQLMVLRVTPNATIAQIKQIVCCEKSLEANKYQLVVCGDKQPQVLDPSKTLAHYAINEITLMSNKSISEAQLQYSTSSSFAPGCEPKKVILSLLNATNQGLNSVENNKQQKQLSTKPAKKRPAPPPPSTQIKEASLPIDVKNVQKVKSLSAKKDETNQRPIGGHTRQNSESDSSGYHESMLSTDSPECLTTHANVEKSIAEEPAKKATGVKKRRAPLPPSLQQMRENRETNECLSDVSVPLSSSSASSGVSQTSDYRTVTESCSSLNGRLNDRISPTGVEHPCRSSTPKIEIEPNHEELNETPEESLMNGSYNEKNSTKFSHGSDSAINPKALVRSESGASEKMVLAEDKKDTSVQSEVDQEKFAVLENDCTLAGSETEDKVCVNDEIDADNSLQVCTQKKLFGKDEETSVTKETRDADKCAVKNDLKSDLVSNANDASNINSCEEKEGAKEKTIQGLTIERADINSLSLLPPPPSFTDTYSETMMNETIDEITNTLLVSKGGLNECSEQLTSTIAINQTHAPASTEVINDGQSSDIDSLSHGEEIETNAVVKEEVSEQSAAAAATEEISEITCDKSKVTDAESSFSQQKAITSKANKDSMDKEDAAVSAAEVRSTCETVDDVTPLPPPSPFKNCGNDEEISRNNSEFKEAVKRDGETVQNTHTEKISETLANNSHQSSILVEIKSYENAPSSTCIRVKSNPPFIEDNKIWVKEKESVDKFRWPNSKCSESVKNTGQQNNPVEPVANGTMSSNEVRFLCRPRKKLTNFRIGAYKNDEGPNIYETESQEYTSLPLKLNDSPTQPKSPCKPVVVTASLKQSVEDSQPKQESTTTSKLVQIYPPKPSSNSTTKISMLTPQPFKLSRISSWNGNERNLTLPVKQFNDDSCSKTTTFEVNNRCIKNRCVSQVNIDKDSTRVSVRSTPSPPSSSPDTDLKSPVLLQTLKTTNVNGNQIQRRSSEPKCVIKQLSPPHSPDNAKSQTIEIRHESIRISSSAESTPIKSIPPPVFPASPRNENSRNSMVKSLPIPPPLPSNHSNKPEESQLTNNDWKVKRHNQANDKNLVPKIKPKSGSTCDSTIDFHQALLKEIRNFKGKPALKKVTISNPWQAHLNGKQN
ncbi:uncharacterized protein B4U79_05037 [Dinothrombium tinctorium]|uniref:WH2 domain-containing protein n=1 Tax=Dinothrombium tinctorium TaxID=1965070 RepID=A0A443RRF3_9ACAR|nr:uncharacterized protein B4U79_05037 [Dinothrombium tinctorium]